MKKKAIFYYFLPTTFFPFDELIFQIEFHSNFYSHNFSRTKKKKKHTHTKTLRKEDEASALENFEIDKMNCRDVRSSETAERTNGRERVDEKETREAHDFF